MLEFAYTGEVNVKGPDRRQLRRAHDSKDLLGDPVASASTRVGRLMYGALGGGLVCLFLANAVAAPNSAVFAVLIAQIFAPLIDQIAISL